jgi:hypothetical protein
MIFGGPTFVAGFNGNVAEPNWLYEGNPQILTTYTNVFKMWFNASSSSVWPGVGGLWYAECGDDPMIPSNYSFVA